MAVLYNSVDFLLMILLLCAKANDQKSWAFATTSWRVLVSFCSRSNFKMCKPLDPYGN